MNQSIGINAADTLNAVITAGFAQSLCSINAPSQEPDAIGQVDLSDFSPRDGLQNLPCMKAVLIDTRPNPGLEQKREADIAGLEIWHILLMGYYPAINKRDQAVVDGVAYDILTVESDSQSIMTRLAVRTYAL